MQIALSHIANTGIFQDRSQVVFVIDKAPEGKFGPTTIDLPHEDGRLLSLLVMRGVARYVEVESHVQATSIARRLLAAEKIAEEEEGHWSQLKTCQHFLTVDARIESIAICDEALFDGQAETTLDVRFFSKTMNQRLRATVTIRHPAAEENKATLPTEMERLLKATRAEILRLKETEALLATV